MHSKEMKRSNQVLDDVVDFTTRIKNETCPALKLVKAVYSDNPTKADEIKRELSNQAKTFASDYEKMMKGNMSYSEMRMLYG